MKLAKPFLKAPFPLSRVRQTPSARFLPGPSRDSGNHDDDDDDGDRSITTTTTKNKTTSSNARNAADYAMTMATELRMT